MLYFLNLGIYAFKNKLFLYIKDLGKIFAIDSLLILCPKHAIYYLWRLDLSLGLDCTKFF